LNQKKIISITKITVQTKEKENVSLINKYEPLRKRSIKSKEMRKVNLKIFANSGKKPQKVAGSIIVVIAAMLLFSGCAMHNASVSRSNAPFYLAYDSDEVIRDQLQVATITSTVGLKIDSVTVNAKNFRSAHSGGIFTVVVADVLPGTHSVRILNNPTGNPVRSNTITYNFEAGQVYNVAIKGFSFGAVLVVAVVEPNTSAEVARKIAENRKNAEFEAPKK
jgi:hypothetical protein